MALDKCLIARGGSENYEAVRLEGMLMSSAIG